MTVEVTKRQTNPFIGNGVTVQFAFTFSVITKQQLEVVRWDTATQTEVVLTLDSDSQDGYSVVLNADQEVDPGGTITYPFTHSPPWTPLASTERLVIRGKTTQSQLTDLPSTGSFPTLEAMDDHDMRIAKEHDLYRQRAIQWKLSDDGANVELPNLADLKGYLLGMDTAGNWTASLQAAAVSPFWAAILDDADETGLVPALDPYYVNVTGDTMTGNLILSGSAKFVVGHSAYEQVTLHGVALDAAMAVHTQGATDLIGLAQHRHSDIAGFGAHYTMVRSRGTETAETAVQNGDNIVRIIALAHDGTDYEQVAIISFEIDGVPGTDNMPGRIVFSVTPTGGFTAAEAFRISQDKSAPAAGPLTINYDGVGLNLASVSASTNAALKFSDVSNEKWWIYKDTANVLRIYDAALDNTIAKFTIGGGAQIGTPTGGDKGAGTLNLQTELYIAGASLSSILAAGLATKVDIAGDTMTGALIIKKDASNQLSLDTATTGQALIRFMDGGTQHWALYTAGNDGKIRFYNYDGAADIMVLDYTNAMLFMNNANGPALMNEAASATNPTLVPDRAHTDSGIGYNNTGTAICFVSAGVNTVKIGTDGMQFVSQSFVGRDVTNGLMEYSGSSTSSTGAKWQMYGNTHATKPNLACLNVNDTECFFFSSTSLYAANASGAAIQNEAASATNPTLCPNKAQLGTGWGWVSNELHAVLNSVDALKISLNNMSLYNDATSAGGGGIGTRFDLYHRTSDTADVGDGLGGHIYYGPDSASGTADVVYARIGARVDSPTSGAVSGMFDIRVVVSGSTRDIAQFYSEGLWLASHENDATAGPFINLLRGRSLNNNNTRFIDATASAGQDNDILARINFRGFDDAATPAQQNFAHIRASITDATAATFSGKLAFMVAANGADKGFYLYSSAGTAFLEMGDTAFKDYCVLNTSPTISAGAITFDYTASQSFTVTLTANITSITLSNPPTSGLYGEIVIKFIQDATGSRTVTGWPSSVKWPGGTAPTITTTATTGTDWVTLRTHDGGTTWYGDYSQDYQ